MDPRQTKPGSGETTAASTRPSAFSHLLYDRGVRFAAGLAIVVAIPVAVLFFIFQRRIMNTTTGAVKE